MMWLNTDVILSSLENVDIVMGYVQLWKAWLLDKMPQDVLAACVGKSTKKFQSVVLAYHAIGITWLLDKMSQDGLVLVLAD
ncbi:uncharacterized protein LOC107822587 isoform X1 [Nicotiana tabacum]|uniref:Uncharacterized protein LOC107822587 isoform X1 n=9 Tax=Nicotiana tabacum TaxID=4097 RepID=A0AC58SZ26_TOBAC